MQALLSLIFLHLVSLLLLKGQQLAEAVPDRLEDEFFLAIVFVVLQAA